MVYGWPARLAGLVLAGLVAACLATSSDDDPARASAAALAALDGHKGPAASATAIDWSQGDCLSRLRTLQQATRDGSLGPDEQPPFTVELVAPTGSWLDGVPDVPIEVDLPLADTAPADAACVLRIGPARDQRAAHRAVDLQDVHSAYQSALRSERNPEYDAAHLKLIQAKAQAKGKQKIVRTNDPLVDLIGSAVGGAIATFDARSRRATLDEAAAELAATPRSRDKPVYRPYSFERVVVRAQKQALVPVALLDAQGRSLRATELRQSERREFFLLRGLDPRDRDYEQHRATSMTRADLARWSRTPPALRLSSVALALTEGSVETDRAPPAPNAEPADATLDSWPDEDALADQTPGDPWLKDAFAAKAETDYGPGDDLADDRADQATHALPIVAQAPPAGERGYDVGDLLPGLASDRTARPAPALGLPPSVVAIRAGSAAGYGFYVRKDMVLTTRGLVGSISVVDVTTADGATVPALVAAVDPARDLALLQVPRPGPTVVLHDGPASAAPLPDVDGGPGEPLFEGDRVIGMTTAGGQGVIAIDAIRRFLAGQAGVLAAAP